MKIGMKERKQKKIFILWIDVGIHCSFFFLSKLKKKKKKKKEKEKFLLLWSFR